MTLVERLAPRVESDRSLGRLAAEISEQLALADSAASAAVEHAIRAGELLLEAKSRVPHGQWTGWVDINVDISLEWASVYMRIARHQDLVRSRQVSTVKGAERILVSASAADHRVDPLMRAEASRLRNDGMLHREIATELGVAQSTITRWLNPAADEAYRRRKAAHSRQARTALKRETRARQAQRLGGDLGEGYSLVRRALDVLERAAVADIGRAAKAHTSTAMTSLYNAEDALAAAIRTADRRDGVA